MQGSDILSTPMLLQVENSQRKCSQIGQAGGPSKLSLNSICVYFGKKNLFILFGLLTSSILSSAFGAAGGTTIIQDLSE